MYKKIMILVLINVTTVLPNEPEFYSIFDEQKESLFLENKSNFERLLDCTQETKRLMAHQSLCFKIFGVSMGLAVFFLVGQVYLLARKPIHIAHFHQAPKDYIANWDKYKSP